jgi:hypothetical protein
MKRTFTFLIITFLFSVIYSSAQTYVSGYITENMELQQNMVQKD